ncbi:MAG TPA: Ppx/GppA phosphatase family protein [Methanoregulaceae archaeon]|nr:Ppx/GppA phosphatase family protein [Methanoregulaceae archaeon]HQJ87608.1 Ppx/GppA phosphatase family protein [Methanoregulaceae archaeon]
MGETVGFLDIGTNSIRLLVVRIGIGGSFSVLSEQKATIRLGAGEFGADGSRGRLSAAAMDRAVVVARRFADLARSFHAGEIVAVATSATRDARNRAVFLERLRDEAGLDVHVVSGPEEARLIHLGVTSGLALGAEPVLVVDIGGGSTELVVGDASSHRYVASARLGSIRLASLHPPRHPDGVYTPAEYRTLCEHCRSVLLRPLEGLAPHRFDRVLGASGTIQNLAEIAGRLADPGSKGPFHSITRDGLARTARHLFALTLEERRGVPGINPDRADIIVPGAAILETIVEQLGVGSVTVTRRGLKEGLLFDYLSRHGHLPPQGTFSVREESVNRLRRVCGCAEAHTDQVRSLARQLFDSGREVGLHRLGAPERELLEYAALVHDCGTFISFSNHHQHSQYIITNAELLGFDEREVMLLGTIARLHRKKFPARRSAVLSSVPEHDRPTVLVLALLLRLAESLDRTHAGLVRSVSFKCAGGGVRLLIASDEDCHLERFAIEEQRGPFRRVFGLPLEPVMSTGD